jgi:ABC-type dipeptide/oligopeptide/nickel transport system ATPase component
VSHDAREAFSHSDRLIVMDGGRIVDEGAPGQLLARPSHAFTAALKEGIGIA